MSLLRNPVAQFLALGVVLITAISLGTGYLASRAAEQQALDEARGINEVLARSVARQSVKGSVVRGEAGAIDRFDRQVNNRLIADEIVRINIWARDGRLVYSNEFTLIGRTFGLTGDQIEVLAGGGTGSLDYDADAPENDLDESRVTLAGIDEVVRIYTRFRAQNGDPLLFETYYSLEGIEERREEIIDSFQWITVGGPVLLVLLVTPMLWVLTGRLTSGAKERERLLNAAIDASDAERRRIARDLHDSVVQDLAGTAFSVSAVARDPSASPDARRHLNEAGGTLRDSLKALRSLLAEIHPPELHADGLAPALADLIAPASTAGVQASVSVEGVEGVSDDRAALVWRVAQEAVRNSLRHADASTLAVTVRGGDRRLVLEVVDDGVGFDPARRTDPSSFGLRGLRSLVAECNGTLEVRSSPGEGTTVCMEVDAQ